MKKFLLTIAAAGFFLPLAAITATLSANPAEVVAGETFMLNVTLDSEKEPFFILPPMPPQVTIRRQSSSKSFSTRIINGDRSVSATYGFSAMISQPGKTTIPAFSLEIDGQTVTTNALTLNVLDPAKLPPDTTFSATLTIKPQRKIYTGELVQTDIEIFIPADRQLAQMPQFTFENFGDAIAVSRGNGGTHFTISRQPARRGKGYTIGFSAIFQVQKSGEFRPLCRITLQSGKSSFWGTSGVSERTITAQAAEVLQILPMPPLPAGCVDTKLYGKWQITAGISKAALTVGEMADVILHFSGSNSALDFKAPALSVPGTRTYPPEVDKNDALTSFTVKYPFVALQPGKTILKENFAVFDPEKGSFEIIPLTVEYTVTPAADTPAVSEQPRPQQNIPPAPNSDDMPMNAAGSTANSTANSTAKSTFRDVPALPIIILLGAAIAGIAAILLLRWKNSPQQELQENLQKLANDTALHGTAALDLCARQLIATAMGLDSGADFSDIAEQIDDKEIAEFFRELNNCAFIPDSVPPAVDNIFREKIVKFIKSLAADLKKQHK